MLDRLARDVRRSCRSSRASTRRRSPSSSSTTPASGRSSTCYGVEDEIEKALARRVDLKSGGYLIIDQTEAMTTIDVNTGGFVGGAQLRRHDLQDQPRGGAGDRAPAAAAQPRRHHHHRLHRHGERRAPRRGAGRAREGARARPHAHDASTASRSSGLVEMTRKRTREIARARAVRALPDLRRARRGQDRADGLLRDPARDPARGAPVQRARVPHPRLAAGDRHVPRRGIAAPRACSSRLHRQADLAAGRDDATRRSSTTSC